MKWWKAIFREFFMVFCWYAKRVIHIWCMYYVCVWVECVCVCSKLGGRVV